MSKYKIYLITGDYTETNEIDEVKIDDLLFHFRRYKSLGFSNESHEQQELSRQFISNCFRNADSEFKRPLFWNITINHVDNKIQIDCA